MKKIILCVIAMLMTGCSVGKEKLQTYMDEPRWFIQDPHYAQYQEKSEALESAYLAKEITYAEYMERKKELDDQYTEEVRHRQDTIEGNE